MQQEYLVNFQMEDLDIDKVKFKSQVNNLKGKIKSIKNLKINLSNE